MCQCWCGCRWNDRRRQVETEVLYGHPAILRNLQWASLWAAGFFVSLLGWLDAAYMVTGCLPLIFPSPNPALLLFLISCYLLNSLNTPFLHSLSSPPSLFVLIFSLSLCFSWFPSMYSCDKAYWSCVLKIAWHTLRRRLIFRMLGLAPAHLSVGCQLPLNAPASLRNTHSTFSPFRLLALYRMQQNAAKNDRPTSLKTPSDDANQTELNKAVFNVWMLSLKEMSQGCRRCWLILKVLWPCLFTRSCKASRYEETQKPLHGKNMRIKGILVDLECESTLILL